MDRTLPSTTPKSPEPEPVSETSTRIQPTEPQQHHHLHAPSIVITYKECLKNHAATLGGHALDGCGEFLPSPTTTSTDPTSLKCAVCGCHRNFHRYCPPPPQSVTSPDDVRITVDSDNLHAQVSPRAAVYQPPEKESRAIDPSTTQTSPEPESVTETSIRIEPTWLQHHHLDAHQASFNNTTGPQPPSPPPPTPPLPGASSLSENHFPEWNSVPTPSPDRSPPFQGYFTEWNSVPTYSPDRHQGHWGYYDMLAGAIQPFEGVGDPNPKSWAIYEVPHRLRAVYEKAYEPNVISIGPYHFGKKHLYAMEAIKRSCFRKSGLDFSEFRMAMKPLEEQVRQRYQKPSYLNSEEFVDMMVYDGCFIVQLMRKIYPDEDIFKVRRIQTDIRYDLLLLENQLPFSLLVKLYRKIMGNAKGDLEHAEGDLDHEFPEGEGDWEMLREILNMLREILIMSSLRVREILILIMLREILIMSSLVWLFLSSKKRCMEDQRYGFKLKIVPLLERKSSIFYT